MFNFLSKFCLLCTSFTEPNEDDLDTNGWVSIPPVTKTTNIETGSEKDDLSIWSLFTKKMGDEKLTVRFPSEPEYHVLFSGDLEIRSSLGDQNYVLRVSDPVTVESIEGQVKEVFLQPGIVLAEVNRVSDSRWDLLFRKDGKWVSQTYLLKSSHLYFFQSENPLSDRDNHHHFVSSLKVIS